MENAKSRHSSTPIYIVTFNQAFRSPLRSLKEAGLSREEREGRRLTSSDQWAVVKASLSRLFLLTVFSPDR